MEVIKNKMLALGPHEQFPCREERESSDARAEPTTAWIARIRLACSPVEAVQTRVKPPRSTEEAVLTRGRSAEGLGLINTGVQVGFVREDFLLGRCLGSSPQDV